MAVADASQLTLDPDLDTFYAMDAVTVRLPNAKHRIFELQTLLKQGGSDATQMVAQVLTLWLLPVTLPMVAAPLLIWWTSRPASPAHFLVPTDVPPPVVALHDTILAGWTTASSSEPKVA